MQADIMTRKSKIQQNYGENMVGDFAGESWSEVMREKMSL